MRLIIGIAAGILLAAGGTGAWMYTHRRDPSKSVKSAPAPLPKVAYVEVKELTMRLADTGAEHYIKLTPVLSVDETKADEITEQVPIVRDRIVTLVTARSSDELSKPDGELKLKRDILTALKGDFHDEVVDIYFSGYLVE
jgi:flagellar FliL protein